MIGLKAGDISRDNGALYYTYRGKGGKQGKRELREAKLVLDEVAQEFDGVNPKALIEEFERIAPRHPVFRIAS